MGLIDSVVDRNGLDSAVIELAGRFGASSPNSLRAAKILLNAEDSTPLTAESEEFAKLLAGPDAVVGIESFRRHGRLGRADFGRSRPAT